MKEIILYGSQYGSARRYAEKLSEQTGIPAASYKDAPDLSNMKTIVYLGGLYAGGVLGLMKTLRGFSLRTGKSCLSLPWGWLILTSRKTGTISTLLCRGSFPPSCLTRRRSSIFAAGLITKSFLSDTAP